MKTLLALLLLIPSLSWGGDDTLESNLEELSFLDDDSYESNLEEFCINTKERIDSEIYILNFMYNELDEYKDVDENTLEIFEDKLFKRSMIYKNICY